MTDDEITAQLAGALQRANALSEAADRLGTESREIETAIYELQREFVRRACKHEEWQQRSFKVGGRYGADDIEETCKACGLKRTIKFQ